MDEEKLKEVAEEAKNAFWAVVAEKFPEIKGHKLGSSTMIGLELEIQMRDAISEWVKLNKG